ncbi:cysteine hydrolase family protein [Cohnella candidum]|uniref:Cysteine hydrolase n=1 Tax=Cohnella candidum TaxID=2674991 RepID=A0A3G3K3P2_9BACL|nr:isochorismatase family cysteine hydrolase [Cohnella candidum]AYQ75175.1 cysteine hydrolase [Cohnella candidum]
MKFKEQHVIPEKTALIVVDVQNDYCHPDGACARRGNDVSGVKGMVPHLAALINGARENRVPVIFIQTFHERATDSAAWTDRSDGRSGDVCRTGTWGAEFYEVSPQAGDIIVNKHRYSAFVNTRLDSVLRTLKVETLIMTGVSTNVCVESTARQGYMLDYNIVLASDACAAFSQKAHEMTLENIDGYFGSVVKVEQILNVWASQRAEVSEAVGL